MADGVVDVDSAERLADVLFGLLVSQQEQADERAERPGVPARAAGGLGLTSAERGVGLGAERLDDAVRGVAGGLERLAQTGAQVCRKIGVHGWRCFHARVIHRVIWRAIAIASR